MCDNLSAGNLKKMKRNSEPSKKHETNASTRMFVSFLGQYIEQAFAEGWCYL